MIGIIAVTAAAMGLGMVEYNGFASAPPSLAPTFMQLDLAGALNIGMISVIFAFLFVDLFDTSGTLIGAAQRGGLLDKDGNVVMTVKEHNDSVRVDVAKTIGAELAGIEGE